MLQDISGLNLKDANNDMTFFELGFDSLLLTPVTFKINEMYKVKITFQQLLNELSTLGSLASYINQKLVEKRETGQSVVKNEIKPLSADMATPLNKAQQWLLAEYKSNKQFISAYVTSVSIFLKGEFYPDILETSLQKLIDRHELLRSTISNDGKSLEIVESKITLIKKHLFSLQDSDFMRLIDTEINKEFDLKTDPLFKAMLIETPSNECCIVLSASNLICDVWSMDILIEELGKLYTYALQNEDLKLAPANSFAQYALEERNNPQSMYWQELRSAYAEQWQQSLASLALSGSKSLEIQDDSLSLLKQFSTKNRCSLFATLLAILVRSLNKTQSVYGDSVIISMAGQAATNQLRLVGQCTNLIPIFNCKSSNESLSQYAKNLQEKIIEAHEYQQEAYNIMFEGGRALLPASAIQVIHTKRLPKENFRFSDLQCDYKFNSKSAQFTALEFNVIEYDEKLMIEIGYKLDVLEEQFINDLKDAIHNLIVNVSRVSTEE
jgi:acyl carrier protein